MFVLMVPFVENVKPDMSYLVLLFVLNVLTLIVIHVLLLQSVMHVQLDMVILLVSVLHVVTLVVKIVLLPPPVKHVKKDFFWIHLLVLVVHVTLMAVKLVAQ